MISRQRKTGGLYLKVRGVCTQNRNVGMCNRSASSMLRVSWCSRPAPHGEGLSLTGSSSGLWEGRYSELFDSLAIFADLSSNLRPA